MLSRPCKRYYEPLRLPARPRTISARALYVPVGGRAPTDQALPWCPHPLRGYPALRTCHPCYPGGSRWAVAVVAAHRAPAIPQRPRGRHPQFRNEATPGFAARYGLCGCARPSGTRSSGNSALPVTRGTHGVGPLPQATWADCQVPGPDFHRQVLRYPRHTDVARLSRLFGGMRTGRGDGPGRARPDEGEWPGRATAQAAAVRRHERRDGGRRQQSSFSVRAACRGSLELPVARWLERSRDHQ
jgi:hypothetical protein